MIPTRDRTGEGETTPLKLTRLRKIGRTYPLCSTGHFTTASIESEPFSSFSRSSMLMRPRPRLVFASSVSKPVPESDSQPKRGTRIEARAPLGSGKDSMRAAG